MSSSTVMTLDTELDRRQVFPTRALQVLFWSYTVFFVLTSYVVYLLHAFSIGSLEQAVRLQVFNVLAMGLQGWFVFLLVRLHFDIKFAQFLRRMDRELNQMRNEGHHPIMFRKSRVTPWRIDGLNELNDDLFAGIAQMDEIREDLLRVVEDESMSPSEKKDKLVALCGRTSELNERKRNQT